MGGASLGWAGLLFLQLLAFFPLLLSDVIPKQQKKLFYKSWVLKLVFILSNKENFLKEYIFIIFSVTPNEKNHSVVEVTQLQDAAPPPPPPGGKHTEYLKREKDFWKKKLQKQNFVAKSLDRF